MMEWIVSGYCRVLDGSRMVTAEQEPGCPPEIDCRYPDCPHAPNCEIAKKLKELFA